MKKIIVTLATFLTAVALVQPVAATTWTERECHTDSYGYTTCRDKLTNVETGIITYTNGTVTYGGVSSGIIAQNTKTVSDVKILNTGSSSTLNAVAATVVGLGVLSLVIKKIRQTRAA